MKKEAVVWSINHDWKAWLHISLFANKERKIQHLVPMIKPKKAIEIYPSMVENAIFVQSDLKQHLGKKIIDQTTMT